MSADITGNSVSFNEYLKLVSNERKSEPDEDALLNMFRWFRKLMGNISHCITFQEHGSKGKGISFGGRSEKIVEREKWNFGGRC